MAHSANDHLHHVVIVGGGFGGLPVYPPDLSANAEASLARLGVTVRTGCLVTDIQDDLVTVSRGDQVELIQARTLLWAAGMKASPIGQVLAQRTGVELDRAGRVMVEPDLSIARHPHIFVIGDLAHVAHQHGAPLPGVAPVAMQQGRHVADLIQVRLSRGTFTSQSGGAPEREAFRYRDKAFRYRDKGNLAVIGRNAAVAELGSLKFAGFPAWLVWLFVHIGYLIEFDNKLLVLIQWAWNYFTRNRGARLITGEDPSPLVEDASPDRLQAFTVLPVWADVEVEG